MLPGFHGKFTLNSNNIKRKFITKLAYRFPVLSLNTINQQTRMVLWWAFQEPVKILLFWFLAKVSALSLTLILTVFQTYILLPYSPLCLSTRTGALSRRYTCVSARTLLVRRSALARAAPAKPLCQLAWRELSDLGVFRLAVNLSWLFCVQSSVLSHSSTRSLVHTEQQIISIKNGWKYHVKSTNDKSQQLTASH